MLMILLLPHGPSEGAMARLYELLKCEIFHKFSSFFGNIQVVASGIILTQPNKYTTTARFARYILCHRCRLYNKRYRALYQE